jgi:hypothetical protein
MFRTGLSLIDEVPGLNVAGMYYASNVKAQNMPPFIRLLHDTLQQTWKNIPLWSYDSGDSTGFISFIDVSNYTNGGSGAALNPSRVSLPIHRLRHLVSDNQTLMDIVDFEDFINEPEKEWIRI